MAALSRNAQVLRYLLGVAPGVGRIKLVKLAYLADCETQRYLGHPVTGFRYRYDNHGPFDRAFYQAKDELVDAGHATEGQEQVGPYASYVYQPTDKALEYGFSQPEAEILSYVAATYAGQTARSLCDDIVYQTPPMKAAKVGEQLDLTKMQRKKPDPLGFNLERMLAGEASAREGRYRPLREAVDELRARHRV
jgi:hypothetical protein